MKRIALISCAKLAGLTDDDRLLLPALGALSLAGAPAVWNDPAVDWRSFDGALLRSCWDYHYHPEQFLQWVSHLETLQLPLWNAPETVRWNAHKSYLLQLANQGVAVVPSLLLRRGEPADLPSLLEQRHWRQAVVKPAIGATAYRTWRTGLPVAPEDQHRFAEDLHLGDILLQPFVEEVGNGEWSFIFLDGRFSHAVLKRARSGDFRVQEDFGGSSRGLEPPAHLLAQAEQIASRNGDHCLYVRLDAVDIGGVLTVMELELIEPALFLATAPDAAHRLAAAVARRV